MAATHQTTQLDRSIGQSALLFQGHPGIGAWKATRAVGPEIAAFTNPELAQPNRLSLDYHARGETDEDGYTYHADTWAIESWGVDGVSDWGVEDFPSRRAAVERLVEIMEHSP